MPIHLPRGVYGLLADCGCVCVQHGGGAARVERTAALFGVCGCEAGAITQRSHATTASTGVWWVADAVDGSVGSMGGVGMTWGGGR